MNLIPAHVGNYPRIGTSSESQLLRRTVTQWERGEKTEKDLCHAEEALTRVALREQEEAGLELVTDGQIRWYDPISHIAGKLEGTKINGLLRFFDTNFYFRQPVVEKTPRRTRPLVLDEFLFAREQCTRPVKPVLTGPFTLAKLSILPGSGNGFRGLVEAYATALGEEIGDLAKAGAEVIQVDEPALLKSGADLPVAEAALAELAKHKREARLILHTHFGDAAPIYDWLQRQPVDVLSFDFTYSPKLVDLIASAGSEKALGFGMVDGRNTKLENTKKVARALGKMVPKTKATESYLVPSCGLEYLPRDRAGAKLRLLAAIRNEYSGGR